MITVTENAVRQLRSLLEAQTDAAGKGLRVGIAKGGCSGLQYEMSLDSRQTARRAKREDPGKLLADGLLLSASVISLAAVVVVLVKAANSGALTRDLLVALAAVSVVIAWIVVHTIFTLRYALLYYVDENGGIDFNEPDAPRYTDFAYLAFTVGMTFQVSDTDIQDKRIRATILRHMWLSYVFGAVIVAITINLIAGLTTK